MKADVLAGGHRNLTPADYEVLEFERARWKHQGRREGAVRHRFGRSLTQHLQHVENLLDHPAAEAYAPDVVRRLRALRDRRRTVRHRGFKAAQ